MNQPRLDIRTYRAKTLREAIARVRRDLGPTAAILHCREIRRSTLGKLWHGSGIEVAAAPSLPKPKQLPTTPEPSIKSIPTESPNLNLVVEDTSSIPEPPKSALPSNSALYDETREVLLDADLASELVDELIEQARKEFVGVADLDRSILFENLVQQLTNYLSVMGSLKKRESENEPRVIAFVGPTGVGKTTTIAKLAATLSIVEGHRVGLITLDGYRVGAIDQLRTYSDMLSLPLKLANRADELAEAIESMNDLDFILIDTDGRSPNDQAGIEHTTAMLSESSENLSSAIDVQLVVSAGTSARGMMQAIKAFRATKPSALLLTKLDEVPTLGQIVKTSHDAALPISYLTDGQGVPEDLEVADAESLARMILKQQQSSGQLAVKTNKFERIKETNSST